MSRAQPSLRAPLAVAVLLFGYALAVHLANGNRDLRSLGAALAVLPLVVVAADFARRLRPRPVSLLALTALTVLTVTGWHSLEAHYDWVLLAQQAGTYLLLGIVFGASLLPGREPLCTRIARMLQGPLDPATYRYTRLITLAWAVLLTAIGGTMLALYVTGALRAWSLFANFGPLVLLPGMFCSELQLRRWRLPHAPRFTVQQVMQAWRRHDAEWR